MFHPPLLANNWFLFCLCLYRDIYSTYCYCDIFLHLILVELHKRRPDFHICVEISVRSSSRVVSNLGLEWSVPTFLRINYRILVQNCKHLLGIGRSTISVRDQPEYMFKKCIVQIMSLLLYISYSVLQMVLSCFLSSFYMFNQGIVNIMSLLKWISHIVLGMVLFCFVVLYTYWNKALLR